MKKDPSICCSPLETALWQEKTHVWKEKLFLQDQVIQFMHIPLNMSQVVTRMFKKIEDADVCPPEKEFLMLAYDPSPWKSEISMTITKPIQGEKMTKLSGTFVSKVFDGPYHYVPKWIKELDAYLASHKQSPMKYYFHYAYCPKCAKKYGHNYCIAFAQVK